MTGVAATLAALAVLLLGGGGVRALDWELYDRWIRPRAPVSVSPALVVVVRDAASEARLGRGAWDRAVLARLVTGLSRAGAAAIGLDVALGQPSAPGRGGAASDALLGQATALAGAVVYPLALEVDGAGAPPGAQRPAGHRSWPALPPAGYAWPAARPLAGALPGLAEHARAIGHTLAPADPDGVVRRVPLFVRLEERVVPAFGLALGAVFLGASLEHLTVDADGVTIRRPGFAPVLVPTDRQGRASLAWAAVEPRIVPFADVWAALAGGPSERLGALVDGKVVLVLAEPARAERPTPLGPASDVAIQLQLLNALLTGSWLVDAPPRATLLGTLAAAALAAWLALVLPWWAALVGLAVLVLGVAAAFALVPVLAGVLLPAGLPVTAVALASAGALLWNQLAAAYRVRRLEGEVVGMREALVRRESAVEALEEDLDAARAAAARSGSAEDALRAQLAEARTQEEEARRRLEALERESRVQRAVEAPSGDGELERLGLACARLGIVTRDPGLLAVFRDLEKAARSSLPILLLGEPGTGKELFARAAHRLSPRAAGPFVAVSMAAISPELAESELFGHVRGSFTGAVGDRKGYFEQADGGTLFLDEVGELRPEHQAKLLRALQERSFHRVGAARPTTVDVRVVAASNRDLERGVREGWFREDLYFRLKGLVLGLPPLRERRGDLPRLAQRLVAEAAREEGRPGLALSEAAMGALERHPWPGNVRELQHCLRRAVALGEGPVLTTEDLGLPAAERAGADADTGGDAAVLASLRQHGFDMQRTARALGWDRSTVTQRLKGLGFRALVEAGGDRARAALALAGDPALARPVELKLREYLEHLLRVVEGFDTAEGALAACRRRFKNLPERHFRSLETLVRQHFERRP
ncbi:MAG TPA: hypothetical protein DDZ42_16910 [Candidatus Rokubacteria bacterium]|nr:MAG: hypothetical protein A2050_05835 [Candidatus Rokubacteria bacterium GWA2_73_35]HBH03573.1 hypothetical protein [Candidatus Rokubacteria bacterium]